MIMIGLMIMNKELIIDYLDELFIDPKCELIYSKDYELLLSVMLSAQTTDKSVNIATKELYKKYDSLEKLHNITVDEINEYIKSIGFHKTKSNNFKYIVDEIYKLGYVPCDRDYLESLKGVGRKTASVVLSQLYNVPSFAVDTHVYRVSKRLGITNIDDDLIQTEEKLKNFFDKSQWNRVNSQLVLFGRYHCKSKCPKCEICKLKSICKKI